MAGEAEFTAMGHAAFIKKETLEMDLEGGTTVAGDGKQVRPDEPVEKCEEISKAR